LLRVLLRGIIVKRRIGHRGALMVKDKVGVEWHTRAFELVNMRLSPDTGGKMPL
jgi:hypothetical protein